jgi:hypothetical protein
VTLTRILAIIVAASLLPAIWSPALAQDAYADAFARAAVLEDEQRYAEAAARLGELTSEYPQDYPLRLQIAWLWFLAKDWSRAERAYRAALDLSPDAADARAGLAWSWLKLGLTREAARAFEAIVADHPEHLAAQQGLAAAEAAGGVRWWPSAGLAVLYDDGHPFRGQGISAVVGLGGRVADHWLLGASYRYGHFQGDGSQPFSTRWRQGFAQHEAYGALGWASHTWGVLLQGAWVGDGSAYMGNAMASGLSARWSPWGDLGLSANATVYNDMTVWRIAPSWRLPVLDWLDLTPAMAWQAAGGEQLFNGSLTAALRGDGWRLWLGGKLGDELRPSYLHEPSIWNLPERIRWGAWLGAGVELGGVFWSLHYEAAHLVTPVSQSGLPVDLESTLNLITLGASRAD